MLSKKSVSKHVRISPRKARKAADLIRGMTVDEAQYQLDFSGLKAGTLLKKTLKSAVANAETQLELRAEDMKVLEVRVDAGTTIKRAKSKSKGGRVPILKRTSHLTVIVGKE